MDLDSAISNPNAKSFFGDLLNTGAQYVDGLAKTKLAQKSNPQPTIAPTQKVEPNPSQGQFGIDNSAGSNRVLIIGGIVVGVVIVVFLFLRK